MSKDYDKQKILEIYNKATKAINKTVREIIGRAVDKYKTNNKGGIGNLIQEYYFGIPANSLSEPDFLDLNLELKVIPLKKTQHKKNLEYTVKERIVFNVINYNDIVNETNIDNSSFISKNRIILLMTYIHDYDLENKMDYVINGVYLLDLKNIKEYEIIKNDWTFLVNTIREGRAEKLSEKDTLILKACTKGNKENNPIPQPHSDIKAKRRAFSFPATFMTQVIERLKKDKNYISYFLSENEIKYTKHFAEEEIKSYLKKTIELNLENYKTSSSKHWRRIAFNNLLKQKNPRLLEFIKNSEYILKVMNCTNKKPNEELNTGYILDPAEILNEEFEDSTFYQEIIIKTFLIIFVDKKSNKIEEIKLFKLNDFQIQNAKLVFAKTKEELLRIKDLNTNYRVKPNFIKISDNMDIHIRPKARDSSDIYRNDNSDYNITKHAFWINKKTIMGN